MTKTITSATNPLIKRIRRLADRKHRRREGVFVVEGVQPVWSAVEAGAHIETLVVAPELASTAVLDRLVSQQEAAGTLVSRISQALFRQLSDRDEPAGLAAVVRARSAGLGDLTVDTRPDANAVFVALHEIGNPGNLGTIIRTADATGAAGLVLIGNTSDPYAPAAVKASMGSLFAVSLVWCADLDEFFGWSRSQQISVVAASGHSRTAHWNVDYPTPVSLLLGTEGSGLPATALQHSDRTVQIPMTGTAESLNLSVAAGVLLYELRREALGGSRLDLPVAGC